MNAIVLGGTHPHIDLILKLKCMGYYVVLVDYTENPPAKFYADLHLKESTLDKEKVFQIAKYYDAKTVISVAIDEANVIASYVLGKMGLHTPYSYEVAKTIANKGLVKKILTQNDIKTANFISYSDFDIHNPKLNYPLVTKPVDNCGSKGVVKTYRIEDLAKNIEYSLSYSKSKDVLIEEFIEGKEYSVDIVVDNCNPKILTLREKIPIKNVEKKSLQTAVAITHNETPSKLYEKIIIIVNGLISIFKLKTTALLLQIIVKDDDVFVIEFAPRISGGLAYKTIKYATNVDIIDFSISSFLNLPAKFEIDNDYNNVYAEVILYGKKSIFSNVVGIIENLNNNHILEYFPRKELNDSIGNDLSSRDRIGAFIIKGKSNVDVYDKLKSILGTIDAFDISKKSILYKNIY